MILIKRIYRAKFKSKVMQIDTWFGASHLGVIKRVIQM